MAITTGLAFARFSRSNVRIRFSQTAVIHPYNEAPTLSLRVANERYNAICDAQLNAFLAFDETSSESHRLRRLKPLKLEREQGVAFLLVWTAMHHIDAASPLHGLSSGDLQRINAAVLEPSTTWMKRSNGPFTRKPAGLMRNCRADHWQSRSSLLSMRHAN